MTVVIQYANAYFNLKNQDLRSNAFVETKTEAPLNRKEGVIIEHKL